MLWWNLLVMQVTVRKSQRVNLFSQVFVYFQINMYWPGLKICITCNFVGVLHSSYNSFCLILCILLFVYYIQVGKIKVTAKRGLKILWNNCQNSTLKMTNGIRKVRQEVDIFDKRILDFCEFISDSASEYDLVYINLFLAAGRV